MSHELSLTDRVYAALQDAFTLGEFEPGQLYSVVEISKGLGVSRTPVREALLQFASEGIVEFERSRGVRIIGVSADDIRDLYELRLMLEGPSAEKAALSNDHVQLTRMRTTFEAMTAAVADGDQAEFEHLDTAFHDSILRAAGNRQIVDAVNRARSQMLARPMSTTLTRSPEEVLAVHREIHDAIVARDPARAKQAVESHLASTRDILIAQALKWQQKAR